MKKRWMLSVGLIGLMSFLGVGFLFTQSNLTTGNSCINFKVKNDSTVFFGNNEDHALTQISDTYITFIPNGSKWFDGSSLMYGAVLVGYGNGTGYSWLQGGMNDHGLVFDSTSVPFTSPNLHNERDPYLVPEIFMCENISEVVEYKTTHNIYQQEGRIQSMYIDKSGESLVFSIGLDGEYNFFIENDTFQIISNFYLDEPTRGNPSSDAIRRYNAAEEKLNDMVTNDNITIETIASVLDAAHFEGPLVNTLYSNIFDVTNGVIYLYYFHQFEEVVVINLEDELAKGWHSYRISDLFTQELVNNAFNEYYEYSFLIRFFPTDILILVITIFLDIIAIISLIFLITKRLFTKFKRFRRSTKMDTNEVKYTGIRTQVILSIPVVWSLLSFPMIYLNHRGEWWPFFDGVPILSLSLQPIYGFYNLFLIFSILGIFLIAFLLYSYTKKGNLIILTKAGLNFGKRQKWRLIVIFSTPIVISILFLILQFFKIIPIIDWLMLLILYPLIVIMLMILKPLSN